VIEHGAIETPRRARARMRAVLLTGAGRFELADVPCPDPSAHEVRVRVRAVGICGTDFHIFGGHANYHTDERGLPVPLAVRPQILGHEIAGVVEDVGAAVRDVAAGELVVVDQGRTCAGELREPRCEYCATGHSHQCEFYREHGITGLPGGFAEFVTVPALNVVRTAPQLDAAAAALAEPLGCVVHATDTLVRTEARYALGETSCVVICGAGPSGLLFVQFLRRVLGFDGLLLVSEPNARRRALAERFGAETIDPATVDLADAVRDRTSGRRAELLIEATGSADVFAAIPTLVRKQATVLLYGHGHAGADLSVLNRLQFLEPTLLSPAGASGGFEADGRPSTYVRALGLIESERIDVASLITHRYRSLESIPAAFAGDHHAASYVKGLVLL
jgi:threonine dehydrogenase-like Zn-dependent dehydrogenase